MTDEEIERNYAEVMRLAQERSERPEMKDEEAVQHMENSEAPQCDRDIFLIAKHIEVSCEPCAGAGKYQRNGEWISMDACWDLLDTHQKYERLKQAKGAWEGIQSIGIETVMGRAFECYLQEK